MSEGWRPDTTLEKAKIDAIQAALEFYEGNKTHAARALKISLRTLRNWVNKHEELRAWRSDDLGWRRL